MDPHPLEISVRPLDAWSDEQVLLAYRLLAGDVQDQLGAYGGDRQELAASRRDAELFGLEAVRRGLLSG